MKRIIIIATALVFTAGVLSSQTTKVNNIQTVSATQAPVTVSTSLKDLATGD